MRIIYSIIFAILTIAFVIVLNTKLILPAPLGKLLSPQHGVWQNAEKTNGNFTADLKFPQLTGKVDVYLDERLVPHVFAEQENDVYFVQGYLHAKFRLWQMELQTLAAAGRAGEIIGEKALQHDREFRRLGMVYAAENSLKEMEKDAATKAQCDAYTAGVNAFIEALTESSLPLEYKLIGYKPEKWTNLKTALFLKYMSYDLAGYDDDFEMTNAKNYFNSTDFALLYPANQDSLDPIIPKGTIYPAPAIVPNIPANADSVYFNNKADNIGIKEIKPDRENGSNNWVLSGKKTKSGSPILCNDPHLGLNLPSLWYEMQLSTPTFNAYGATFPGAPSVIIGFNDSCAFGFTNGGRDVRDYYEIKFRDDSHKEYWYNNHWIKITFRIDTILLKDKAPFIDSVAYTVFGPVMYDKNFDGGRNKTTKSYAVKWKAHDGSNELTIFTLLNRAKNYTDYSSAVTHLHTPGQNVAFACKNGDIAIRTQGEWPAKWKGQGDFVMPGSDSSYMWQGMIPQNEVPFQYNPERGFVSSANQKPTDTTYPYYLGRRYPMYRGLLINRLLTEMNNATVKDMMALQNNNYNVFAEMARPIFLKNTIAKLNDVERYYFDLLKNWDLQNDVGSKGATVFEILWENFDSAVFDDEFAKAPKPIARPFESSLLESILKDSAFKFIDNIETSQKETLQQTVRMAFKKTVMQLDSLKAAGKLDWEKYKNTHISHLAKLDAFSKLNLPVGGGTHNINATRDDHGPSWRMIVSLTAQTEAYGVYPGGQSGNPGSKFYDNFVDYWISGKYYQLWLMKKNEENDKRVKWKMSFGKG